MLVIPDTMILKAGNTDTWYRCRYWQWFDSGNCQFTAPKLAIHQLTGGVVVLWQSVGYAIERLRVRVSAGHYGIKTLGKFLTPMVSPWWVTVIRVNHLSNQPPRSTQPCIMWHANFFVIFIHDVYSTVCCCWREHWAGLSTSLFQEFARPLEVMNLRLYQHKDYTAPSKLVILLVRVTLNTASALSTLSRLLELLSARCMGVFQWLLAL